MMSLVLNFQTGLPIKIFQNGVIVGCRIGVQITSLPAKPFSFGEQARGRLSTKKVLSCHKRCARRVIACRFDSQNIVNRMTEGGQR